MTRPGRVVMGNWIPNDPTLVAQILKISSALPAAAGGFHQPHDLGRRSQRYRALWRRWTSSDKISCVRDTYTFNFPGAPSDLYAVFRPTTAQP